MKAEWMNKLGQAFKRFRYPALVLLVGIVLMLLPLEKKQSPAPKSAEPTVQEVTDYKTQMERQLKSVLEQVSGAGRVSVMLSLKSSQQTVYQVDSSVTSQTADGSTANTAQETTVLLSRDDVGQEAAVVKTIYPSFLGAVVVCQGADDPEVTLRIIGVVQSATGLGSEKITVVKMK